jgi:urease accessory protein
LPTACDSAEGTRCSALAAAVKLLRLGQNAVQTLLASTLALCNQILDTALSLRDADLGSANPWWDIASSSHETATHRLFIS